MKKRIFSIAAIFLLVIISLCGCQTSEKELKPTEKFFVNDFANVISDTEENEIYSRAVALQDATTAQVVVVTVDNLNGAEPSQFATNLANEWQLGTEEKDNGILILLSLEDREIFISTGQGLEGALPDSKTGRIIDRYGLEYLKADDFSKGITEITKAIINEVYIEYGLEAESGYTPIDKLPQNELGEASAGQVAASWGAMIVCLIVFFLIFGRRGGTMLFFLGRGGFGGHGGFGSGGGFGGFSGGGGSFGGGGAGRRF